MGTDLDPESDSEHLGTLLSSRCFELVHVLLEKHLEFSVRKTPFLPFWDIDNFWFPFGQASLHPLSVLWIYIKIIVD